MDPVSAIGLASAIVSFIGLGVKLLHSAKEIRDSANDSLERNESRELIVEAMQEVAAKLKTPDPRQIPPDQQKLCDLAVKCNDLSQKIVELLNKTKVHLYRAAYHAWRKEDDIKVLEKSLGDCRNQLALSLTQLSSQNSTQYSKRILALVRGDSTKLEQLQAHMNQLRKGVEVQAMGNSAIEQLRLVLGTHEEALSAIYQDRILRSLQFEDMHRRDDGVRDPHENTFKWILEEEDDSSQSSQDTDGTHYPGHSEDYLREEMYFLSRTKFLNWLSSQAGIFHVSGKLGSGKSTLMKLISTHPRTRAEAEKWAGDRKLVLASFFFWKPGSELQKSLNGLFRTLLCDILTACPYLIRDTLPEYWRLAEQAPWQVQTEFNIPASTINAALKSIISNPRLYTSHRFCFFIDGLDEYEGTDGQDPTYLVSMLNSWANDSHGCLKLCVSSREHNVFMNAFSKEQRLRLHELTLFDMQEYVVGSFRDMQTDQLSEDLRRKLIEDIPRKADGIFLWTILVMITIRRKVEDGEPEENLMQLLDSLPQELNSLLRRALGELDADNRKRLFQTMAMLQIAKAEGDFPFTLLAFSFLDDYEKDPAFSLKGNISADKTEERAQKRLRGACRGLVEAHGSENKELSWRRPWGQLEYTHRSVPEMFDEGDLKHEMQQSLKEFDASDALSHLSFAAVQSLGRVWTYEVDHFCAGLARMRLVKMIEQAPYPFLESMSSWLEDNTRRCSLVPWIGVYTGFQMTSFGVCFGVSGTLNATYGNITACSVLCIAASTGCFDYLKWKLEQGTNSPLEKALLAQVALIYCRLSSPTLDLLFDCGLLTDPTAIGFVDQGFQYDWVGGGKLSIWQRFPTQAFLGWTEQCRGEEALLKRGQAILKFLELGAPRRFYITTKGGQGLRATVKFSFEGTEVILRACDAIQCFVSRDFLRMMGGHWVDMTFSFRDWIQATDFQYKDRILVLLGGDGETGAVVDTEAGGSRSW